MKIEYDRKDFVEEFEKVVSRTGSQLKQMDDCLQRINGDLSNNDIAPIGLENVSGHKPLQQMFNIRKPETEMVQNIEQYIIKSRHLVLSLNGFNEAYEKGKVTEEARQNIYYENERSNEKEKRKDDRIDQWKIWSQKTVRWAVGAFIAVLLYSTAAYFSDRENSFVKIPIKDWIQESKKVEKLQAEIKELKVKLKEVNVENKDT